MKAFLLAEVGEALQKKHFLITPCALRPDTPR
jgi:hypothetical protein